MPRASRNGITEAGKHVHIDKPAGASLPAFRRILDSARKQKLLVQMGYMYRYNPAVVLLRELLKKGWLGEVFEVHAVMSKVVAPAERKQLARFKGGILFELGCHVLDLVVADPGAGHHAGRRARGAAADRDHGQLPGPGHAVRGQRVARPAQVGRGRLVGQDYAVVAAGRGQRPLDRFLRRRRHRQAPSSVVFSTRTPRISTAGQPWLTGATCPGWPLPQLNAPPSR